VSQAVNSTLDLETVLTTIVAKAVQLSAADGGAIYVFDRDAQEFQLRATDGGDEAMIVAIRDQRIRTDERIIQLGRDFGDTVEVVAGLDPQDRVIDSPPETLQSGDVVQVAAPTPVSSTPAGAPTRGN
jgi:GAF domain-containing protein